MYTFASKTGLSGFRWRNISETPERSFHRLLCFQGFVRQQKLPALPRLSPDYCECIIQIPAGKNSSDQCEEQTGQARSVDEADIDPARRSAARHPHPSSLFVSFLPKRLQISPDARQKKQHRLLQFVFTPSADALEQVLFSKQTGH